MPNDECAIVELSTDDGQAAVDADVVADTVPYSNYIENRESYRDFASLQTSGLIWIFPRLHSRLCRDGKTVDRPDYKTVPNVVPWCAEHTRTLNRLKQALCDATNRNMYAAELSKPIYIYVDASDSCVPGYLGQCSQENVEHTCDID